MQRLGDVAIEIWEKKVLQGALSGRLNRDPDSTVADMDQDASAATLPPATDCRRDSCDRRFTLYSG
jgi:hypothetical protein